MNTCNFRISQIRISILMTWGVKQLLPQQVLKMAHWPLSYLKTNNSGNYAIYTLSQYKAEEGYYEDPDNWDGWVVTSPEQPAAAKNKYIIPAGRQKLIRQSCIYFLRTYK